MRRLFVFAVLACALAVPAAGLAGGDGSSDGTLSVRNAAGRILLKPFNGSAIGRVGRGKIVITDFAFGDGVGFDFSGCDNKVDRTDTTSLCTGTNLRFRAIGGTYKIFIAGGGISLSAVGRGAVSLDGRGDEPVLNDGVFSVNDSPYRSLPTLAKTYTLSAPAGD